MNGDDVLGVLREIRDEVRATNQRLDQTNQRLDQTNSRLDGTNSRLESLEGRVEFLEHRVSEGFERLTDRMNAIDHSRVESEMRIATAVLELTESNRQIRDLLANKLDDHDMVMEHEGRIRVLEDRAAHLSSE